MATVRRSTMEDMPAVTRMTMDFLAISPYDKHMTLDPVALEQQFRVMQDNENVACFVAEIDGQIVGMLACCVTGCWFNPGVVIASELGWWIEPHARGTTCAVRLLNEFERWGRDKGAVLVAMSLSQPHSPLQQLRPRDQQLQAAFNLRRLRRRRRNSSTSSSRRKRKR